MEQSNQKIEATWSIALKIFWSWLWPTVLLGIPVGIISGFICGFVFSIAGLDKTLGLNITFLLNFILGFIISLFYLKKIICKKFNNFSLILINCEQETT